MHAGIEIRWTLVRDGCNLYVLWFAMSAQGTKIKLKMKLNFKYFLQNNIFRISKPFHDHMTLV